MGAATLAKLHSDPVFWAELEAAKKEYIHAVANVMKPSRDCKAEAETLAIW